MAKNHMEKFMMVLPWNIQKTVFIFFECQKGHKNFVILQEERFETLFQIGANAIIDGYYREAVNSFTTSLERFYEFSIKVFCNGNIISLVNGEIEKTLQRSFEGCLCSMRARDNAIARFNK